MRIGYVSLSGPGAIDACLTEVADRLAARGLRLAGCVRVSPRPLDRHVCDMELRVLPDGPVMPISQTLGAGAGGCRLDGGALEAVAVEVGRRIDGAAVLIVNKFGRNEVAGRGLVPAIAAAVDQGTVVLVGVTALNLAAFRAFAGDLALRLPGDPMVLADWAGAAAAARA